MKLKKNSVYIAGVVKATIFGLTYLVATDILEKINCFDLLAFRFLIAAITFELLRLCKIIKLNFKGKNIKGLILISMFQPIGYYIFETLALTKTSTLISGIIVSMTPLAVMILEAIILKERTSFRQKIFLLSSISGVLLMGILSGGSEGKNTIIGIIFISLAVIFEGFFNVFTKKYSNTFSPIETTYVIMMISAVFFNAVNAVHHIYVGDILNYFAPLFDMKVLFGLLYLGILASCFAYLLYTYMLSKIQASATSVYAGIVTVVTILSGVIFKHENFYWYHAVGTLLILMGVWGINHYRNDISKSKKSCEPTITSQTPIRTTNKFILFFSSIFYK